MLPWELRDFSAKPEFSEHLTVSVTSPSVSPEGREMALTADLHPEIQRLRTTAKGEWRGGDCTAFHPSLSCLPPVSRPYKHRQRDSASPDPPEGTVGHSEDPKSWLLTPCALPCLLEQEDRLSPRGRRATSQWRSPAGRKGLPPSSHGRGRAGGQTQRQTWRAGGGAGERLAKLLQTLDSAARVTWSTPVSVSQSLLPLFTCARLVLDSSGLQQTLTNTP